MTIQSLPAARQPLTRLLSFGIGGDGVVADQQPGIDVGCWAMQPVDEGDRGVVGVGAAEDQLEIGIVEREARAQRQLVVAVDAAQRAQDAHGRGSVGRRQQRLLLAAALHRQAVEATCSEVAARQKTISSQSSGMRSLCAVGPR